MVTEIDWSGVADPGYDCDQGIPSRFEQWFKAPLITIRRPNGETGKLRLPRDVKQQSSYDYHKNPSENHGLASPVLNGTVNKNNGWMGDNVTLLSPEAGGVSRWGSKGLVDKELEPAIDQLVNDVTSYSQN